MFKWVMFILIVLPLFVGCAAGYTRVGKAPETGMKNYDCLVVQDFTGSDQVPPEIKKGIPEQIVKDVQEAKLFPTVARGDAKPSGQCITLQGQVIQYNPGSRSMRYLTGPFFWRRQGQCYRQYQVRRNEYR